MSHIYCNPTPDNLDNKPLDLNIHSFLIYETKQDYEGLKTMPFEERPQDYKYADESKLHIPAFHLRIGSEDMELTAADHRNYMISLLKFFSMGDMQKVALAMFKHFSDGSGSDFSNSTLNEEIKNHSESKNYVKSITKIINDYLSANGGDISGLRYQKSEREKSIMVKEMTDKDGKVIIPAPKYSDKFSGLGICVDGLYGNKIEITSFKNDGQNYIYTVKYTLYDIFGLDDGDIESEGRFDYGRLQGFRSWYILQHCDIYDNYQPFITYIEFENEVTFNNK